MMMYRQSYSFPLELKKNIYLWIGLNDSIKREDMKRYKKELNIV